ncbi:hypothetical protein M8C21_011149 [Ambrosia artemisiifolia]|uniref:Replication factor A C-terminal domain-containing protein n=1 Tax=Ambrosia artemisiifolia TaxID=4212 RepID=A0AAD5BMK8_AMBAR|nr:hypothetical protein M8C21_011149 [Ambrosia artemisiifolia]
MDDFPVTSIVPDSDSAPIAVRFIRKWLRNNNLCYFVIDKHGDGIQADVHYLDKDFFEKQVTLLSCYILDNYICTEAPASIRVNAHPASIHLGTTTSVGLIPTPETFPLHYFNFCPYADLPLRTEENHPANQPYILTDYVGRLEDTTPSNTKKMRPYLRVTLTDISGPTIDVALWEDVLPRFDRQAMLDAEEPIIVAFTSLKVSIFKGYVVEKLQLSSTPATHIYFNPSAESAAVIRNRFKAGDQHLLPPAPGSQTQHLRVEDRNRRTISDLLQHHGEGNQGQVFTCVASIKSYIRGRPWYYTACPHCPRQIYQTKKGWKCGTHEILPEPKFMYCIGAEIKDNTAPTTATFFDDAAATLLGIQCKDMVLQYGLDRYTLPKQMHDVIEHDMIMQLQYARSIGNTSNVFSINKVFVSPPTITATPPSPSQQTTSAIARLPPTKPTAKRQLYQPEDTSDPKRLRFTD